jgi:hypothetical protein
MFELTTKKDIREVLGRSEIYSIGFLEWVGPIAGEGEARSIELHLAGGRTVVITATAHQTLRIIED